MAPCGVLQLQLLLLLAPGGRSSGCRPRLYVYRLPDGYRDNMDTRGRGMGIPLGQNGTSPFSDLEIGLYDSDAYAGLGEIFYERAMGYRCRTYRPSDA